MSHKRSLVSPVEAFEMVLEANPSNGSFPNIFDNTPMEQKNLFAFFGTHSMIDLGRQEEEYVVE